VDDVSRETISEFGRLVLQWTKKIQLISGGDVAKLVDRHIRDSIEIVQSVHEAKVTWLDFGSGAGFPGIVAAILDPARQVTLVESDQRKAAFLRTARRSLSLTNLAVEQARIEDLPSTRSDIVSARAVAPLSKLLTLSQFHARPDTIHVFPKGRTWQSEVATASEGWSFDYNVIHRPHGDSGPILQLRNVRPKDVTSR
jgi:16S rRNA (guanine527-N7)-methyltransferase